VPFAEKPPVEEEHHTIGYRLNPTILDAVREREKAKWTGYLMNIAAALQILLGALTTGLAASLTGKQVSIAITILGGMSTLVASYLARARGLNEPELSNIRRKGLDQLIRDCRAFKLDHEDEFGTPRLNHELKVLRKRFEELLQKGDELQNVSPPVKVAGNQTDVVSHAQPSPVIHPQANMSSLK
jgi:hypothetical protein